MIIAFIGALSVLLGLSTGLSFRTEKSILNWFSNSIRRKIKPWNQTNKTAVYLFSQQKVFPSKKWPIPDKV